MTGARHGDSIVVPLHVRPGPFLALQCQFARSLSLGPTELPRIIADGCFGHRLRKERGVHCKQSNARCEPNQMVCCCRRVDSRASSYHGFIWATRASTYTTRALWHFCALRFARRAPAMFQRRAVFLTAQTTTRPSSFFKRGTELHARAVQTQCPT